jgi:transcriptional regulator with XRE-family HTH domain
MADSLGISTTSYGDIERGKTDLTLSRLHQIAEVFEISITTLLGETTSLQQELQQLELEKLRIENEQKFSLQAMDVRLHEILNKYVPEFSVETKIVLPKLNKIELPKLNKVS